MKAIPTKYNGVRFRSRLEASYAHHFDERKIIWQYEPEGFELNDGTRYLPDFYFPNLRTWVEVKGDHFERMTKAEQFAEEANLFCGDFVLFKEPKPLHWNATLYDTAPWEMTPYGLTRQARWARCEKCHTTNFVFWRQDTCRVCGHWHDMTNKLTYTKNHWLADEWMWSPSWTRLSTSWQP